MDASYSLFKLLWLRGHRPAEFARIALIADPSAYLLVRLGAPPTADWSHASRTALFDPWRTAWDDECVAAAGLPASALPELVPSGTVVGRAKSAAAVGAGIPAGTPLVAGGHDHLCGAYASGVREPCDLYLSAGTSEAQLILAEAAGASAAAAASGFDVGRYVDDVHWYLHVGRPLGQAYRKWRELLFGDAEDGVIEAEIEAAIGADAGILFDPPSLGAGAMLSGLPLTASRGSILRAVVEGSAMASAGVTRRLGDAAGEGSGAIVVSGHAAHSALWRGLRAGLTGRAMEIVDEPEAAALGAALLAQRAVTGRADPDVVSRTRYAPSAADLALAAHLEARYAGNAVSPSYSRADAQ